MAYRRRRRRHRRPYKSFRGPKGWFGRATKRHYRRAKRSVRRNARGFWNWFAY
jgi:hypothetical protein